MLHFDGGMTASIYASFRAEHRTWLEVLGTKGVMTVPNPFRPGPLEHIELARGGKTERIPVEGSPLIFLRQVEDFEARILDAAPSVVTLDESRLTAATLAALYKSAAAHQDNTETPRARKLKDPRRRASHGAVHDVQD